MRRSQYTNRLTKAISYAEAEAGAAANAPADARHLLLGLLREGMNVAAVVMWNTGADRRTTRRRLRSRPVADRAPARRPALPSMRSVLSRAKRHATVLHHTHLGSEHVLLALTDNKRVAAVMAAAGIPPGRARADLLVLLGATPGDPAAGTVFDCGGAPT